MLQKLVATTSLPPHFVVIPITKLIVITIAIYKQNSVGF
jgi:hypothetical protein